VRCAAEVVGSLLRSSSSAIPKGGPPQSPGTPRGAAAWTASPVVLRGTTSMAIMRPTGCRSATGRLRRGNGRPPTRSATSMRRPHERETWARCAAAVLRNLPPMRKKGPCPGPPPCARLRRAWDHERRHARRERRRRPKANRLHPSDRAFAKPWTAARRRTRTGRLCCRSPSAVLERQRGSGLGFGEAHHLQAWRTSSRVTRQTSDSFREGGSRRTPSSYGPSRA
jgi:hypothetical protein